MRVGVDGGGVGWNDELKFEGGGDMDSYER